MYTAKIVNTLAVILWFSVSFVSLTTEAKEVIRLHPANVICLFTDFYLQTTHILSPMMPETAQTCLEYLFATGQVDKSVVFWNTAWCAAGESGLCRCESESQNCLWQCLTGCHPLLTVLVGESVPITTAISPIATVSAVDEWLFGGLAILRTEMDDLRVSWSARGYRHPSSVSGAGQSVMCWRGLVARRVLALFLSECSLFRAREVDCEWEGSHDNDIIILKALIVPNTARNKDRISIYLSIVCVYFSAIIAHIL